MASLSRGDNFDWLWGSLKPWQILHSTLAERQRCGNVLDVWELVNQTLSASILTRGQEGDGGRSRTAMHFLGDIIDGDFWRHGGVLEYRVKECLNALKHEEADLAAAHHLHHHSSIPMRCSAEDIGNITSTIACKSAAAADSDDCKVEEHKEADDQEQMYNEAAASLQESTAAAAGAEEEEEQGQEEGIHGYRRENLENSEEEEEENENSQYSSAYNPSHIIRASSYSLISSNYDTKRNYREISRDSASVVVLDSCRSSVAAAEIDDQAAAAWGKTAKIGVAPLDLEENIDVCAVCLEKLTHYYEEGVQALACRHAFHRVCIAPWLQRQPHACCPCCRAPICADNLPPPLYLGGALDLPDDQHASAGVHEEQVAGNDIMGLLADVEAALERLGFRS